MFIRFLGLDTYAEDFFVSSFQNEAILQKISADELQAIIDQYINIFRRTGKRSEKIFELFNKMILFNNRGNSKNQLEVYRIFFSVNNPLMISIEHTGGRFTIEGVELISFCEKNPAYTSYLAKQIKFYALLTADRNYVCSKTIKKMFPLSILYSYFMREPASSEQMGPPMDEATQAISEEINQSFLHIIVNSYLNERPRFVETHPLVYSMTGEQVEPIEEGSVPSFETEIGLMRSQGLSQESINDIISCIHQ